MDNCLQNKQHYPLDSDLSSVYRYPSFGNPGLSVEKAISESSCGSVSKRVLVRSLAFLMTNQMNDMTRTATQIQNQNNGFSGLKQECQCSNHWHVKRSII